MYSTEDRVAERCGAVGKGTLLNTHRLENAEVHVRHPRFPVSPICPMLEAHICSTRDQRRQVTWIVRRTRATSKHHNRVVEQTAISILISGELTQEVSKLLA